MTRPPHPPATPRTGARTRAGRPGWRAKVATWAASPRPLPLRHAVVAVAAVWALLLLAAGTTLAAVAAPKGGGLGAFAVFDTTDSRGIRVSQYELSIDTGLIINPLKIWLSQRLLTGWDVYRYSVGLMAYIVDWTISMSWLSVITAPLQDAATQIRNHVISPSGLAGLMLLLSAAVGGVRMVFGRLGAGLWDIVSALVVASAVSLLLVSPVSAVTGDPLTKVRNTGVAIAAMIDNGGVLASTDINDSDAEAKLAAGPVLIDSLVRPAHGLVNYGVNFTDDQKCTPTYDQALKAGPYWDPEAAKQREAVAGCDKTLGAYADNAIYTASLGMSVFLGTAFLVGGLILTASALMFIAVMMLAWNLLKLVITGVIGIGPGDTRGPLIRNACQAAASLIYVGVSVVVLAVILVLIKRSFSAADTAPMVRFLLADVVIIAGLVVVAQTWMAHRRGADSWAEKLMTRMKQTAPKPTIGAKVGSWLKAPAGGEAGKYGDFAGAGAGGGWGGSSSRGMGVGRMMRPITHSNAFQLAKFAGFAAATGGAGAVTGAAATVRGTAQGAQLVARGARTAHDVHRTYNAVRSGARHATAGPRADAVIDRTLRARSWLHDQTATAASSTAATALLHLGRTGSEAGPATGAPAHHRSEQPGRSRQRIQAEEQLRRLPHPAGTANRPAPGLTGPSGTQASTAARPRPARSGSTSSESQPAAGRPQQHATTGGGQDSGGRQQPRTGGTDRASRQPSVRGSGVPITVESASTAADRINTLVHPRPSSRPPQAADMRR